MGDGQWGGPDTGGGRLNTDRNGRRGGIYEENREETGKMLLEEQGARMNLGGGERKGPHHHRRENIDT